MIVVVLVVAAVAGLIGWWMLVSTRSDVSAEVNRFATARAMTTRWAVDPTSAPKPVRDMAPNSSVQSRPAGSTDDEAL